MTLPVPLKILNVLACVIFAAFAWLQKNDIDPAIYYHPSSLDAAFWLLFYALIAALFLAILFKPIPRWLLVVAALACLIEMGRTAPGLWENIFGERSFTMMQESMSGDDPRVELSREFFGAFISLGAVVFLYCERSLLLRGRRRESRGSM